MIATEAPRTAQPSTAAAVSHASYMDIRSRYILVRHEPARDAILVLLRVDGCESSETRGKLRDMGLHPDVSAASVSWRLDLGGLGAGFARIACALGDAALLDVGTCFHADRVRHSHASLPREWSGRFLLHVGGTRRCLVLDAASECADLTSVFQAEVADYFANEHRPATE